jgi:hypothetical protein
MTVMLTLAGDEASSDELRGLRAWLVADDELRGRVRTREGPPDEGKLGPVLESLEVIAQPAAAALAASLIAWLRSRVSRFRLEVRTARGAEVVLDSRQVKAMDPQQVNELIGRLSEVIDSENGPADSESGSEDQSDPRTDR